MTDKKLTYKEIIKALEYCKDCSANLNVEIIDLITHQQTENENLKVENQSLRSAANSLKMHYEEAQAEIERLRKEVNLVSIQFQDLQERYEEAQAEIERLKINLNVELENFATEYDNKIKSEAYKEFAERLKNEIINDTAYACDSTQHSGYYDYQIKIGDIPEYIDNLVKEMEGNNND